MLCSGSPKLAAAKAHEILGIKKAYLLEVPDNRMDSIPLLDIVQRLEDVLKDVQPVVIHTHHCGDLNVDHGITHQATLTACRPIPGATVTEIYAFEVLSSTEWSTPGANPFSPNVFVDIFHCLDTKISDIKANELEMRIAPHSRSIENSVRLAELHGNTVGVEAAEGFSLVRALC